MIIASRAGRTSDGILPRVGQIKSKLYVGTAKNPKIATLEWDYELTGLRGKAGNLRIYFGRKLLDTKPNGRLPVLSEYRVGKSSVFQIKQTTVGWMRLVRFYLDGVELRKTSRDDETMAVGIVNSLLVIGLWNLVTSLISGWGVAVSAVMAVYGVCLFVLHRRRPDLLGSACAVGCGLLLVISLYAFMLSGFNPWLFILHGFYLYYLFGLNHFLEKRSIVAESS